MPSQTNILSIAGKPSAISQPGSSGGKLRRWTGSGAGAAGGIQHTINRLFRTEEDTHGRKKLPHIMDEKDVTKNLGLDNTDEQKIQDILTRTRADFGASSHLRVQRVQHARARLSDFLVQTKRIPSDVRMEVNRRAVVWWRKFGKTDYEGKPMIRHIVTKAQVESPTLLKGKGSGWQAIPKGRVAGGQRKRVGGKWVYRYTKEPSNAQEAVLAAGEALARKHPDVAAWRRDGVYVNIWTPEKFSFGDRYLNAIDGAKPSKELINDAHAMVDSLRKKGVKDVTVFMSSGGHDEELGSLQEFGLHNGKLKNWGRSKAGALKIMDAHVPATEAQSSRAWGKHLGLTAKKMEELEPAWNVAKRRVRGDIKNAKNADLAVAAEGYDAASDYARGKSIAVNKKMRERISDEWVRRGNDLGMLRWGSFDPTHPSAMTTGHAPKEAKRVYDYSKSLSKAGGETFKHDMQTGKTPPGAPEVETKGGGGKGAGGGGPYIGPRGGKWADPDHTIPYKEGGGGGGGAPGAEHEAPTGHESAQGIEDGMDGEGTDIPEFKFRITGKDHAEMAKRLAGGIQSATDMCKLSPPMCHENLGVERKDMPQLDDAVLPAFLKSYQDKGVTVKKGTIEVGRLKATQKEISAEKASGMAGAFKEGSYDPSKKPIIISKDGYVLDGHHRWAAMVITDPASKMRVYQVDTDINTLLKDAGSFEGVKQAAFGKETDGSEQKPGEAGPGGKPDMTPPKPETEVEKSIWMRALGASRRASFLRG